MFRQQYVLREMNASKRHAMISRLARGLQWDMSSVFVAHASMPYR
jgi:hypothetical protein